MHAGSRVGALSGAARLVVSGLRRTSPSTGATGNPRNLVTEIGGWQHPCCRHRAKGSGSSRSRIARGARPRPSSPAQIAMAAAGVGVRIWPRWRRVVVAVVLAARGALPRSRQKWRRTARPLDSVRARPDHDERRKRRFASNRTLGTGSPVSTAGGTAPPMPCVRDVKTSRRRSPRQRVPDPAG